mgnify:CR=1 FL=1
MVTMGKKNTISLSKIAARVWGVAIIYPIREVRAEYIDCPIVVCPVINSDEF